MHPTIIGALSSYGLDITKHKQTKLTRDLIVKSYLLVAMAKNHQQFIKENFDLDVPLFNELAVKQKTSVYDVSDMVPDYRANKSAVDAHLKNTISYIHDVIPNLGNALKERLALERKVIK